MRICPVCRQQIPPTMARNVAGHLDGAGRTCPMSGHPYELALIVTTR